MKKPWDADKKINKTRIGCCSSLLIVFVAVGIISLISSTSNTPANSLDQGTVTSATPTNTPSATPVSTPLTTAKEAVSTSIFTNFPANLQKEPGFVQNAMKFIMDKGVITSFDNNANTVFVNNLIWNGLSQEDQDTVYGLVIKAYSADGIDRDCKIVSDNTKQVLLEYVATQSNASQTIVPPKEPYATIVQNAVKSGVIMKMDMASASVVVSKSSWAGFNEWQKNSYINSIAELWDSGFNVYESGTNRKVATYSQWNGTEYF